jgi:Peptidase family M23
MINKTLGQILLLVIFILEFSCTSPIHELLPAGGGEYAPELSICITPEQREIFSQTLKNNVDSLVKKGLLSSDLNGLTTKFQWPLKYIGPWNSYYGITNFVDEGNGGPVKDYTCGNRTYKGHTGTDILNWPFPWHMVAYQQVQVIAAADGVIIGRQDGNQDSNCVLNNNPWNGVALRHADGSVTCYLHMKKDSVTPKKVGQNVANGEYLGVVASSGYSNTPHLHFEVWKTNNSKDIIDPWWQTNGCNHFNPVSWWTNQPLYRDPTINLVSTHFAVPVMGCPGTQEAPNFSDRITKGKEFFYAAYFRDNIIGSSASFRIRRPDGTIWKSWQYNFLSTNNFYWLYYGNTILANEPDGIWKFEVGYYMKNISHDFTVAANEPVQ